MRLEDLKLMLLFLIVCFRECEKSLYFNYLKNLLNLLDYPNQTAISQSRQGFPPLRALDSLIKLTMTGQKIYRLFSYPHVSK